jgi:hypothetical protein
VQLPSWLRDFNAGDNEDIPPQHTGAETGIVNDNLGGNDLPVYAGGANGTTTTTNKNSFDDWWTNATTPTGMELYLPTTVAWVQDPASSTVSWSSEGYWPLVSRIWMHTSHLPSLL